MEPNVLKLSGARRHREVESWPGTECSNTAARVRCSAVLAATGRSGKVACMAEVREVLDEALKLRPEDRASVAAELLESLEETPEDKTDVQAVWAAEIERRARRVLRGESKGTAWDEVRRRTEANLAKR